MRVLVCACRPARASDSSAPLDALMRGGDRRERVQAQLQVPGAPAEVVHDGHRIAARAQVQRCRPPAVPIPACPTPEWLFSLAVPSRR